jgi:hypothetical protein
LVICSFLSSFHKLYLRVHLHCFIAYILDRLWSPDSHTSPSLRLSLIPSLSSSSFSSKNRPCPACSYILTIFRTSCNERSSTEAKLSGGKR